MRAYVMFNESQHWSFLTFNVNWALVTQAKHITGHNRPLSATPSSCYSSPPPSRQLLSISSLCGRGDLSGVLTWGLTGWCLIAPWLQVSNYRADILYGSQNTFSCSLQRSLRLLLLSLRCRQTTILNEWVGGPRHQCGGTTANPTQRWFLHLREHPPVW